MKLSFLNFAIKTYIIIRKKEKYYSSCSWQHFYFLCDKHDKVEMR